MRETCARVAERGCYKPGFSVALTGDYMNTRCTISPKYLWVWTFALLLWFCADVGAEVSIRDVIFLSPVNRQKCSILNQTNDQARTAFNAIEQEAEGVLGDTPRPIATIHYEGILETDRRRIDTEDHLRDMDKLALVTLAYSGKPVAKYESFIKKFVWAWATTYNPTGNPINENKLEAVYGGYYLVKNAFTAEERITIESWMKEIARKELRDQSNTNWETKRFKIVAEIALACESSSLMNDAVNRFKRYVPNAINGDGSTVDFTKRDALSYHRGGLRPLLIFCLLAEQARIRVNGSSLYQWEASNGGSVKKAVHFLDPYVKGEKQHTEFENSTVAFDRERCQAGIEKYCPHPFDPNDPSNADIYAIASGFEPELSQMAALILNSSNTEYPTWLTVMAKSTAISMPRVGTPSISPDGGTYSTAQHVTITCATQNAAIYYTTDGTVPTANASRYTSPIELLASSTVRAIATKQGMLDSEIARASFVIHILPNGALSIQSVTASGDDGNVAQNTIDGDMATRWSSEGDGEWIRWDLGEEKDIGSVKLAFFKGDQRKSDFSLEFSADGTSWTKVFTGKSSGTSTALEEFRAAGNARYVRYVGGGNSANLWNSITETLIMRSESTGIGSMALFHPVIPALTPRSSSGYLIIDGYTTADGPVHIYTLEGARVFCTRNGSRLRSATPLPAGIYVIHAPELGYQAGYRMVH